jgi:hypothetical protein
MLPASVGVVLPITHKWSIFLILDMHYSPQRGYRSRNQQRPVLSRSLDQ